MSPETVKSPVTTKLPDVVITTSVASPIVTLSVIWGSLAVKLLTLTFISVFVIAPLAAPKYAHCVLLIVTESIFYNCAPSSADKLDISVTWEAAIVLLVSVSELEAVI